jgi:hypothetical protein
MGGGSGSSSESLSVSLKNNGPLVMYLSEKALKTIFIQNVIQFKLYYMSCAVLQHPMRTGGYDVYQFLCDKEIVIKEYMKIKLTLGQHLHGSYRVPVLIHHSKSIRFLLLGPAFSVSGDQDFIRFSSEMRTKDIQTLSFL